MNYEAAIALTNKAITPSVVAGFNNWWQRAWTESLPLSTSLIDDYARARAILLRKNPDLARFIETSKRQGPEFGSTLWIEAGKMSGGVRNQVEFSEGLAPFFGAVERRTHCPPIRFDGRVWRDRPLSYKKTTFSVDIWRLSLPTKVVDYADRVLRFRRLSDARGVVFELQVADFGSAAARRWKRASESHGHVGVTGGGREYGLS
jgi:hypothetical protein